MFASRRQKPKFSAFAMVLTLTILTLVLASPASAQRVTQTMTALARAQDAHALGDNLTALNSVREAEEALWNSAPLGIRQAVFVTELPTKFGFYTPKVGEDFTEDEPIIIYCEPIGYTQPKGADGTYNISLVPSLHILDSSGKVLGGEPRPAQVMAGHRSFCTEFMVSSTMGIRGLAPGTYVLRLTLTDSNDPTKSVEVDKVFNWLPPAEDAQ
ncbi:MAG: hypothetical protein LBF38_00385 [Deltaproteobacteria bacterium]|jgi:hypothetical protein|nr:hypothetical protein [Deltaproteobacteria bacterium]